MLTTTTGTITSPNYPSFYVNDITMSWVIEVPGALSLKINFNAFESEPYVDGLYYGVGDVDTTQSIGLFTESYNSIPEVVITGNRVWFYFYTDVSVVRTGFSLTWCAVTQTGI